MRYGLAFYELDGPLFALESGRRHMSLYVAEQEVVVKHKESLPGVNVQRSFVKFSDLNRLPLDIVEKIVRDSVAARRTRASQGALPTQAELLKLWAIKEEAVQVPVPAAKTAAAPAAKAEAGAKSAATAPTKATKPAKAVKAVKASKATKSAAPAAKSSAKPAVVRTLASASGARKAVAASKR